jgi:hypothetical protein
MNHKLQLRTLLASLNEGDLFKVLDGYITLSNAKGNLLQVFLVSLQNQNKISRRFRSQ